MTTGRFLVAFAGVTVAVETSGPKATALAGFLFDRVVSDADVPAMAMVQAADDDTGVSVTVAGENRCWRADLAVAGSELMGEVMHLLARDATGGLVLHAAAVTRNGQAILMPGPTRHGKTTMSAWLAAHGCGYLSDELVFVPAGSTRIHAFDRPIQVRRDSAPLVVTSEGPFRAEGAIVGEHFHLVRPEQRAAEYLRGSVELSALLFPAFDRNGSNRLVPLTKAQAGLRLMECLINARNLPGHGFGHAADLARRIPAWRVDYAEIERVGGQSLAVVDTCRGEQAGIRTWPGESPETDNN
jgi:hypothetical protein